MSSVSSRWFFLLNELNYWFIFQRKSWLVQNPGAKSRLTAWLPIQALKEESCQHFWPACAPFQPQTSRLAIKSMFICCECNTWDLKLAVASWIKELETLKSKALVDFQLETNRQANFAKPSNHGNPESSHLAFDWKKKQRRLDLITILLRFCRVNQQEIGCYPLWIYLISLSLAAVSIVRSSQTVQPHMMQR